MKQSIFTFVLVFTFLFICFDTKAQNYTEYQLPHPNYLSPLFVGSISESAIYYGKKPSYSNSKPVLVFVHGFIDLANAWFAPGNDMYNKAYYSKHRTAFVAMTRGGGMWENGAILADMLEDITDHYNTNQVVIIAHSNGGKASEVAMFHHNKSHLVNRVITLGTPFKGTGLADLAETPAFNWLVDFIGLGGGTSTSTTYYMEGVARPMLDNEPDNQPNKFINFGAWGYNDGTTLAAPAMTTGGLLLNQMGAGPSTGGNDGVTPYYSSTRPGGSPQWPGYCAWWWCNEQSEYDHRDITFDYVSWNEIKPYFTGNLNNFRMMDPASSPSTRGTMLESNYELISTMDGDINEFTISENSGKASISIMHKDQDQTFEIFSNNNLIDFDLKSKKGLKNNRTSTITLMDDQPGKYSISSGDEHFAAMVSYEKGDKLLYDNSKISYLQNEWVECNVELIGENTNATITGIAYRKNDLMGNPVNDDEALLFELLPTEGDKYQYIIKDQLKPGVYNLTINAEGDNSRRTLVTGFVVQSGEVSSNDVNNTTQIKPTLSLSHFPNPVIEKTTVEFKLIEEAPSYIYIYDAYGKAVIMQEVSNIEIGKQRMELDMSNLSNGTYFIEFRNGANKVTKPIVKLK